MQIFPEKLEIKYIGLIVLLAVTVGALFLFKSDDTVFHAIDSVGICVTIYSLLLVLDQLSKTEKASEAARKAADSATQNLTFFLRACEIARIQKLIDEVKQCNRDKKKDIAIIRLQDVRSDLVFLQDNPSMKEFIDTSQFEKFVQVIAVMIHGFEKDIQQNVAAMDCTESNKQLDKMALALIKLESKLKQQ